jgi:hypothetical protein
MKKQILKNLKKYEKNFDRQDRLRLEELNQEIIAQRRQQAYDIFAVLTRNKGLNLSQKYARIAARDGYDSDDDRNYDISVQVILLRKLIFFVWKFYLAIYKYYIAFNCRLWSIFFERINRHSVNYCCLVLA